MKQKYIDFGTEKGYFLSKKENKSKIGQKTKRLDQAIRNPPKSYRWPSRCQN